MIRLYRKARKSARANKKRKGDFMTELSNLAKEAQRAYLREWRRKNPEKVRESNRRYWERKAAQLEQEQPERGGENNDAE